VNPTRLGEIHFHGENRLSPFVSVTAHRDIAIAVGRRFGKKGDGRKFTLLKLRVPKIDLIHFCDHAIRIPSVLDRVGAILGISIEDEEKTYPFNRESSKEVESYVF
jgi:hypothetical protein